MRHRQREGAPLKLPQERVLVQRGGYAPQLRQLSLHADALTVSDLDDAGECDPRLDARHATLRLLLQKGLTARQSKSCGLENATLNLSIALRCQRPIHLERCAVKANFADCIVRPHNAGKAGSPWL